MAEQEKQHWTQIIQPHKKWYNINLSEVWEYRDLILILVRRDIVASYMQTVLGPLWLCIAPIFTVLVYVFMFSGLAKLSTDSLPAPLFYIAGVAMWNYFQSCFTSTSNTFVSNAQIFGKVYFPRLVSPISVVISSLVKFGIQFLLFLGFYAYYYWTGEVSAPNQMIWLIPILVVLTGIIALGGGIIISSLTTKYRDLTYFVTFGVQLIMFTTPVIIPVSAIDPMYRPYALLNPLSPLIETFRFAFTGNGIFDWGDILYSSVWAGCLFIVGVILFSRTERTFMDTV